MTKDGGGGVHCPSIHFTDHNLSTAYKQLPCFCPSFDLHLRQHFQSLSIDNLPAQRLNRPIYLQPSSSCQVKPVGNRRTILTRVCGIFPLRSITCLLQIISPFEHNAIPMSSIITQTSYESSSFSPIFSPFPKLHCLSTSTPTRLPTSIFLHPTTSHASLARGSPTFHLSHSVSFGYNKTPAS